MVCKPISTATAIIKGSERNGQKTVKHRYHLLLFQYHYTNTKSIQQKILDGQLYIQKIH